MEPTQIVAASVFATVVVYSFILYLLFRVKFHMESKTPVNEILDSMSKEITDLQVKLLKSKEKLLELMSDYSDLQDKYMDSLKNIRELILRINETTKQQSTTRHL